MVMDNTKNKKLITKLHGIALVFAFVAACGTAFLLPNHSSVTVFLTIVFFAFSIYMQLSSKVSENVLSQAVVFGVLIWFMYGAYNAFLSNHASGCAAFFGEYVQCYSYESVSFIIQDAIGSVIVIGALGAVIEKRRSKNYSRY